VTTFRSATGPDVEICSCKKACPASQPGRFFLASPLCSATAASQVQRKPARVKIVGLCKALGNGQVVAGLYTSFSGTQDTKHRRCVRAGHRPVVRSNASKPQAYFDSQHER